MVGFAQTGTNEASQKAFYVLCMLAGIAFVPAETLLQVYSSLTLALIIHDTITRPSPNSPSLRTSSERPPLSAPRSAYFHVRSAKEPELTLYPKTFGGLVGVAITTSLFQSKAGVNVPLFVAPAALAAGIAESSIPDFM